MELMGGSQQFIWSTPNSPSPQLASGSGAMRLKPTEQRASKLTPAVAPLNLLG
jgi:hypothetical protein